MALKAVILDLGKTLVNDPIPLTDMGPIFERYAKDVNLSSELAREWFEIYAESRKLSMRSLKEATFLAALEQVSERHELRMSGAEKAKVLRFMYEKSHGSGYSLLPGAKELLAYIKARGLRLGLISNTAWPGRLHEEDMKRLGIFPPFDSLIWSSEERIRKPHIVLFLKSLRELGVSENEAGFGGDNFSGDVAGANNAGIPAIWISDKEPPYSFYGWQVKDLFEMMNLLSKTP